MLQAAIFLELVPHQQVAPFLAGAIPDHCHTWASQAHASKVGNLFGMLSAKAFWIFSRRARPLSEMFRFMCSNDFRVILLHVFFVNSCMPQDTMLTDPIDQQANQS